MALNGTTLLGSLVPIGNEMNRTNGAAQADHSHAHSSLTTLDQLLNTLVLCSVILMTVIGNLVAIAAFVVSPNLKKVTNYFIVLLCVSDVTIATLAMPFWVSYIKTGFPDYIRDETVYTFFLTIDMFCSTSSIMSLAVISFERYLSIAHPMRYDTIMTKKTTFGLIGFVLIYSLTTGLLGLVQRKTGDKIIVPIIVFILAYAIPITVKLFSYGKIYQTAKKQMVKIDRLRRIHNHLKVDAHDHISEAETSARKQSWQQHASTGTTAIRNEAEDEGGLLKKEVNGRSRSNSLSAKFRSRLGSSSNTCQKKPLNRQGSSFNDIRQRSVAKIKRFHRDLRAAKVLGLIIGTFVLLWTPFMTVVVITSIKQFSISLRMILITKDLHYMNSAINPILYVLLNRAYRRGVKKVWRLLTRR